MFGFKSIVAAVTVATLVGSSAFAADVTLASGKPAGVRPAQAMNIGNGTLYIGLAAAAIITGVAITVSNQSGDRAASGASLGTGNTVGVTPGTTS
jgi:hypothetical protein